jgi:hypothetical protein
MTAATHSRSVHHPRPQRFARLGALLVIGAAMVVLAPSAGSAQPSGSLGSAWSLPDPNDLMARVIRRIVTQDKPGGVPIAEYPARAFGREETAAAIRAFAGRAVVIAPDIFADVMTWPVARAKDTLPCAAGAALTPASASGTPSQQCAAPNALWLAVTKIERGELPHELHVWYVTRFRSDAQGSVQTSTYSFCERWLRVRGVWKYDGFVRMTNGVVAP